MKRGSIGEGIRRLALLSGALGAILGTLASFGHFETIQARRAAHTRFEQAANTVGVKIALRQLNAGWLAVPSGLPASPDDPYSAMPNMIPLADQSGPVTSTVYFEGESGETVKTIRWEKRRGILSIEMLDGQTLYATANPGVGTYILMLAMPFLVFLVPWSAVRAAGWVLTGFIREG